MIDGVSANRLEKFPRFTIGVLLDSVDSFFIHRTICDLIDTADEHNIHLVFYFGGSLEKDKTAGPYSYTLSLPDPQVLNALIVLPNTICPYSPQKITKIIIDQFPEIPVYSFFAQLPGYFSVSVDETSAIESLVNHLVDEHLYKKFAVLNGPDSTESVSRARLNKIQEILQTKNLFIDGQYIFSGNFAAEDGRQTARTIFSGNMDSPDVLICMNDQMAIGAIKEFVNNGISIPEDIAIVGFDDVEENSSLPCSFSTINFPMWEMISTIIEKIDSDLSGKTTYIAENIVLSAQFMHRESCGCTSWFEKNINTKATFIPLDQHRASHGTLKRVATLRRSLDEILESCIQKNDTALFTEFIQQVIFELSRSGDLTNSIIDIFSVQWTVMLLRHNDFNSQVMINTLFVDALRMLIQTKMKIFSKIHTNDLGSLRFYQSGNALLSQKVSIFEALKIIGVNLPQLGINRCLIIFLSSENPEIGEIRLTYKEGYFNIVPESKYVQIPIKKLVDNGIATIHEPVSILTIAHENNVYGYLVLSIMDKHFEQFSMIQKMVSQIVDSAMVNELLSNHIQKLTRKNDILSRLSVIDEFTGLYNRRALYVSGKNMYQTAMENNESSCFIFLDMDGLKKINDNYGHTEGDGAILSFSNILKKCFRDKDLLVRYGGDEFVVLMINIQEETLHQALDRISAQIDEFNQKKEHEWILSVSWGYAFNTSGSEMQDFDKIIEESDTRLYDEKRKKKSNSQNKPL